MSQIAEYVKIAIGNIKSNKGRSILTMLGIIIGISSVIMIISIGNGIKAKVNGDLNAMAGGQLYIYADNNDTDDYIEFTDADMEAIRDKVDYIKGVTPDYSMWGTLSGRKGAFDCYVEAGNAGLEYIKSDKIVKGRYFSDSEYYAAKNVCVIPENAAVALFGTTDVIGMEIEIGIYGITQNMTIVGLRETPDSASIVTMMSGDTYTVEIPISTLGSSYGFYVEGFDGFYVIADSATHSTEIAQKCINLLEGRCNVRGQGRILLQDFNSYLGEMTSILDMITLFIVFVAAISLLVGGIGVMNIMLVSVTERTREIGIRKSLGARTSSIMMQFLSESAIISLMGGLIGIILGVLGATIVCALLGAKVSISVGTVLGASIFSSAVGIFFGIYPAKKAAKMSPIEALRRE